MGAVANRPPVVAEATEVGRPLSVADTASYDRGLDECFGCIEQGPIVWKALSLQAGKEEMRSPGWCSGPSYDPVTVVTRVQIPLRAFSDFTTTSNRASGCEYGRNQKRPRGI